MWDVYDWDLSLNSHMLYLYLIVLCSEGQVWGFCVA
jgi:hypothetical protein